MKLLLDECIPRKLKDSLPSHDCRTVPGEGLAGKKNGALLTLAVVLIRSRSSRLVDLLPQVPDLLRLLESLKPGQLARIDLIG